MRADRFNFCRLAALSAAFRSFVSRTTWMVSIVDFYPQYTQQSSSLKVGRRMLSSIQRDGVALIERYRVWAGLELHGLTPDERLVVDARGDHQVVGSRG